MLRSSAQLGKWETESGKGRSQEPHLGSGCHVTGPVTLGVCVLVLLVFIEFVTLGTSCNSSSDLFQATCSGFLVFWNISDRGWGGRR